MNLPNRRLTPRTPESDRVWAAVRAGVAHLRANPSLPVADSVAVVVGGAK